MCSRASEHPWMHPRRRSSRVVLLWVFYLPQEAAAGTGGKLHRSKATVKPPLRLPVGPISGRAGTVSACVQHPRRWYPCSGSDLVGRDRRAHRSSQWGATPRRGMEADGSLSMMFAGLLTETGRPPYSSGGATPAGRNGVVLPLCSSCLPSVAGERSPREYRPGRRGPRGASTAAVTKMDS
ncbi:hypothetical protein GGS23DRAFT_554384 [Durotheca rogersii]|uniref:uncharacterized protein n=1 Tax=Durotheca rogersii TaxID=419775 RepID=UPI00222091CD|nr:uncharacterized protein GGS23DRAFT_554384 [Durotheca rogersii]KAI5865867.1 hypothetical protein GGS23DRAFT_554384 [Durotheca rogersii]